MIFKGHYRQPIDDKDRIKLPAAMRQQNDSGYYTITRGFEHAIFLYPAERWKIIEKEAAQLNSDRPEVRQFYRTIFMWAFATQTDEMGRIEIPNGLMTFASLGQEALILGSFDHIELWDPDRFDDYLNDSRDDYDTLVSLVLDR